VEVRDFKTAAKVVAEYLGRDGVEVSQSKMLEALSRGFGGRNWVSFRESLESLTFPDSGQDPVKALTAMVRQLLDAMVAQEQRDSGLLEPFPAGIAPDWRAAQDEGARWLKLLAEEGPVRDEPKWLTQVNALESDIDMRAISETIKTLAEDLGSGPENVDFSRVSRATPNPQHLVAVLRGSFAMRQRVPGWYDLRDFAMEYLASKGMDAARSMRGLGGERPLAPSSTAEPMCIPGVHTKEELAEAMPVLKHLLRQMMFPLTPVDRMPPWEFAMIEEAIASVWRQHGNAAELKHIQEFLESHPDRRAQDMAFQLSPWTNKETLRWFDGVSESYVVEHGLDGFPGGAGGRASSVVRDTGRGPSRVVLVSGTLIAKSNGVQVEAQATLSLTTGEVCTVWSPGVSSYPVGGCENESFFFEDATGNKFPLPVVSDEHGNKRVAKEGREYVRYLVNKATN
jgi:hypothetical protein